MVEVLEETVTRIAMSTPLREEVARVVGALDTPLNLLAPCELCRENLVVNLFPLSSTVALWTIREDRVTRPTVMDVQVVSSN